MKKVLAVAAALEAATGLLLIVYPPIVVRLLLGLEITDSLVLVCRIFGISLVALAVACWPGGHAQPLYGMLTYGALVTLYLIVVGIGGTGGILLWPAVVLHALLTVTLWGRLVERTKEFGNIVLIESWCFG